MINFKEQLNKVRCFIFDVDGVLTNGSLIVMPGELVRVMNIKDGFAIKEAVDAGYQVIILSGGKSESVRTRLVNLGVKDVFLGVEDKLEVLNAILVQYKLSPSEIIYMGDDIPDLEPMKKIGVPVCPNDAAPEIKNISVYISPINGGEGCARDVIEQVMRLHGKWKSN